MLFRAAWALLSWICHCWVRRSFSPKEVEAFSRALRRVSIFFFWASISLPSTWFRAVRASTESSCLSNWDCTTFISEPRTLKDWLMSASAFLNSFSPSSPIFRPKLSAIRGHLLQNGIKKARISPGKRKEPIARLLEAVYLLFISSCNSLMNRLVWNPSQTAWCTCTASGIHH